MPKPNHQSHVASSSESSHNNVLQLTSREEVPANQIPTYYYVTEANGRSQYSYVDNGKGYDLLRDLQGLPPYLDDAHDVKVPKVIVYYSWQYIDAETADWLQYLQLEADFILYYWDGITGKVTRTDDISHFVAAHSIGAPKNLHRILPIDPQQLLSLAALQLSLRPSQIQLVNQAEVNFALKGYPVPEVDVLSCYDIVHMNPHPYEVHRFYHSHGLRPYELHIDRVGSNLAKEVESIAHSWPGATMVWAVRAIEDFTVEDNSTILDKLVKEQVQQQTVSQHVERLILTNEHDLNEIEHNARDWHNTQIKSLVFANCAEAWIDGFETKYPNLEHLSLGIKDTTPNFKSMTINVGKLTALSSLTVTSFDFISNLEVFYERNAFKNLQKLKIISCGKDSIDLGDFFVAKYAFMHVEHLVIEINSGAGGSYKNSVINALFHGAYFLKNLKYLKIINHSNQPIQLNFNLFVNMLSHCGNVISVHVEGLIENDDTDNFDVTHLSLPKLKKLHISRCQMREEDYRVLMHAAQHVRYLDVTNNYVIPIETESVVPQSTAPTWHFNQLVSATIDFDAYGLELLRSLPKLNVLDVLQVVMSSETKSDDLYNAYLHFVSLLGCHKKIFYYHGVYSDRLNKEVHANQQNNQIREYFTNNYAIINSHVVFNKFNIECLSNDSYFEVLEINNCKMQENLLLEILIKNCLTFLSFNNTELSEFYSEIDKVLNKRNRFFIDKLEKIVIINTNRFFRTMSFIEFEFKSNLKELVVERANDGISLGVLDEYQQLLCFVEKHYQKIDAITLNFSGQLFLQDSVTELRSHMGKKHYVGPFEVQACVRELRQLMAGLETLAQFMNICPLHMQQRVALQYSMVTSSSSQQRRAALPTPNPTMDAPLPYGQWKTSPDFSYKRIDSLGQDMITMQLSQYLTLTKSRQALIPHIRQGICSHLAAWALEQGDEALVLQRLEQLRDWDGCCLDNLHTNLRDWFEDLLCRIDMKETTQSYYFHGAAVTQCLEKHPGNYILSNGFHAITVLHSRDTGLWVGIEPNASEGPTSPLTLNELLYWIQSRLGLGPDKLPYIRVKQQQPHIQQWSLDTNDFILYGGLLILASSVNANELLNCLLSADKVNVAALEGLCLFHANKPLWLIALNSHHKQVSSYTSELLQRYVLNDPNVIMTQLIQGLSETKLEDLQAGLKRLTSQTNTMPGLLDFYQVFKAYVDAKVPAMSATSSGGQSINQQGTIDLYTYYHEQLLAIDSANGQAKWITRIQNNDKLSLLAGLLSDFINFQPHAVDRLIHSMSALSFKCKVDCYMALIHVTDLHPLTGAIRAQLNVYLYQQRYQRQAVTQSLTWHLDRAMSHRVSRQLIWLDTEKGAEGFAYHLWRRALSESIPVFFAYSPSDLIIRSKRMLLQSDNTLVCRNEEGGRFANFLRQHQGTAFKVVLLYDAEHFDSAVKVTQSYSFLSNIPAGAQLIAVASRHEAVCLAPGFSAHFQQQRHCCVDLQALTQSVPKMPPVVESIPHDSVAISLYHAPEWPTTLSGSLAIDGPTLSFTDSIFVQALTNDDTITFDNAPWDDKSFKRCYDRLVIQHEFLRPFTTALELPMAPICYQHKGYDWARLTSCLSIDTNGSSVPCSSSHGSSTPDANIEILNPSTLRRFFPHADVDKNNHAGISADGYVKEHTKMYPGKPMQVLLTRAISLDDWAKLLDACIAHGVTLVIKCLQGVNLPKELSHFMAPPITITTAKIALIETNDVDTSVYPYQQQGYQTIKVTAKSVTELLRRQTFEYSAQGHIIAHEQETLLFNALRQGKSVVLYGKFTEQLIDELTAYVYKRQYDASLPQGEIICMADNAEAFHFMPPPERHQITTTDKQQALKAHAKKFSDDELARLSEKQYQEKSLAQLVAILINHRITESIHEDLQALDPNHPDLARDYDGYEGFKPSKMNINTQGIDFANSEEQAFKWLATRAIYQKNVLKHAPWVYLTGPTGAGKTKSVEDDLAKDNVMYYGLDAVDAWLHVKVDLTSEEDHILLLDEANLMDIPWLEALDGLLENPPRLCINGVEYYLSPKHKIVLTGNPLNYGAGRYFAEIFSIYGFSCYFKPLAPVVIYEYILKPIFSEMNEADTLPIINEILAVYQFICQCSPEQVLITPRELTMLALLAVVPDRLGNQHDIRELLHLIAKPLVPASKQQDFNAAFPLQTTTVKMSEAVVLRQMGSMPSDFVLTPSRLASYDLLTSLLELSSWRRDPSRNEAHKYQGLHGIILEAESGEGMSSLVRAALAYKGYIDLAATHPGTDVERGCYWPDANTTKDELNDLLLRAWRYGHSIVLANITAANLDEELLNKLLMGRDRENNPPLRPGFLAIGMQRPDNAGMLNRLSPALLSRCMRHTLTPYSAQDEAMILTELGMPSEEVKVMVQVHQEKKQAVSGNETVNINNLLALAAQAKNVDGYQGWRRLQYQGTLSLFPELQKPMPLPDTDMRDIFGLNS